MLIIRKTDNTMPSTSINYTSSSAISALCNNSTNPRSTRAVHVT